MMKNFTYTYPTHVYFGEDAAQKALNTELHASKTVMLAYGGGSVKKNGIYDEIMTILREQGKSCLLYTSRCV